MLIAAVQPVTDPDFWWHVTTGNWILSHHAVPHHDLFTYTVPTHRWITHEWLSEAIVAALFAIGHLPLVSLVLGGVTAAGFLLVYMAIDRRVNFVIAALSLYPGRGCRQSHLGAPHPDGHLCPGRSDLPVDQTVLRRARARDLRPPHRDAVLGQLARRVLYRLRVPLHRAGCGGTPLVDETPRCDAGAASSKPGPGAGGLGRRGHRQPERLGHLPVPVSDPVEWRAATADRGVVLTELPDVPDDRLRGHDFPDSSAVWPSRGGSNCDSSSF